MEQRTSPTTPVGMHTVKEMDMLTAKLDLLLKKVEE
jgi:hypothetical protein